MDSPSDLSNSTTLLRVASFTFGSDSILGILWTVLKVVLLMQCVIGTIVSLSYLLKEQSEKLSITCKCWLSAALLWSPIVSAVLKFVLSAQPIDEMSFWSLFLFNFILLLDYAFLLCLCGYTVWLLAHQFSKPVWWFGVTTLYNILPVLSCIVPAVIIGALVAIVDVEYLYHSGTFLLNVFCSMLLLGFFIAVVLLYNTKGVRSNSIRDVFPEKYLLTMAACVSLWSHLGYNSVELWSRLMRFGWAFDLRWCFMFAITDFLQSLKCSFCGCCKISNSEGTIVSMPSGDYEPVPQQDTAAEDTKVINAV